MNQNLPTSVRETYSPCVLPPTQFGSVAIIGKGKISSHIPRLFSFLTNHFTFLDRFSDYQSSEVLDYGAVFLAVEDRNIEAVYSDIKTRFKPHAVFFHLSGTLNIKNIIGVHPLMTFTPGAQIADYSVIPIFTDDENFYSFNKDKISNLRFIPAEKKAKYHAMAVMLGNFSQYYLQFLKENFPKDLNFEDYKCLVLNSVNNIFQENSLENLTGPLVRKDKDTILKHKKILEETEPQLLRIYQKMEELFQQEMFENEN